MPLALIRRATLLLLALALPLAVVADDASFRPFRAGSQVEILNARTGQPFMLFLWSASCEACLKQLPLLRELSRQRPRVALVLVATDDIAAQKLAGDALARHGLEHEDVWMFAAPDPARLRAEIDPRWDGRLPRTYLYDASHARQTIAGALDRGRVLGWSRQVTAMH